MTTYIALLRAINVGGYRKIKMESLREMFEAMGFENVSTYIQSGNVVFEGEGDPSDISKHIERQIKETFGHEVPTIIRSPQQVQEALKGFPFEEGNGWKGYITFLMEEAGKEQAKELESLSSGIEKFKVAGSEIHVLVDKETDEKPLFSNSFVEKRLDTYATSRNLRTVRKILDLAL